MGPNNQPKGLEQQLLTAQNGVATELTVKSSLTVAGVTMTQAQIESKIDALVQPFVDARNAQHAFQAAVVAREQGMAAAREFFAALHTAIVAQFGRRSPLLVAFGFKPATVRSKSSAENLQAAAKAKVTREKRNTLGKRQKAALRAEGPQQVTVTTAGEIVVGPATPPAAPSGSAGGSNTGTPTAQ